MPFCFISSMISCNRREKSVQKEWMFVGTEVNLLPACTITLDPDQHSPPLSSRKSWWAAGHWSSTTGAASSVTLWVMELVTCAVGSLALTVTEALRSFTELFLTQPLNATLSHLSETDLRTLDAGQWRQKHHCVWISCWFSDV